MVRVEGMGRAGNAQIEEHPYFTGTQVQTRLQVQ
jgi:hypothetical protein